MLFLDLFIAVSSLLATACSTFCLFFFYLCGNIGLCDSETVKFGHVTFFWNGNRSGYFDETKEEYVEVPSDSGITFNVAPKMKALEIAEKARDALLSGKFDQVNSSEISIR